MAVVGGGFFLATALFIERDRNRAENYVPTGETGWMSPEHVTVPADCLLNDVFLYLIYLFFYKM